MAAEDPDEAGQDEEEQEKCFPDETGQDEEEQEKCTTSYE